MEARKKRYDTLRFLAIFWVFTMHFFASYSMNLSKILSYILYGITGKLAVAMFGVLLEYFSFQAYQRRMNSNCHNSNVEKFKDIYVYTLKRWVYFVFSGFLINATIVILSRYVEIFADWKRTGVKELVITSLKLGSGIFPTYWCILDFFFASVISYINGRWLSNRKCVSKIDERDNDANILIVMGGGGYYLKYLL